MLAHVPPGMADEAVGPKGAVEITVGTAVGGAADTVIREVAKAFADSGTVTQPLVIQNRAGGSWMVAANWVLGKPGNKNLVLAISGPIFTTPIVQKLPAIYDRVTPIAMISQGEQVIGVQPDSDINTLKDLVARASKAEGSLTIAGGQAGSADQIATAKLEMEGHVKFNYVPFAGGGAAQAAFLGKNSDFIVVPLNEALPLMKSGKLKLVALLSQERSTYPEFKDVPTALEQGFNVTWSQNVGLAGPPNLDPAVVAWWNDRIKKLIETDEWKKMMSDNWLKTNYVDSGHMLDWMKKNNDEMASLLQGAGLSKN
jgi:putative tricarboxylic transport membrane protein